jgi:hypothetical protein
MVLLPEEVALLLEKKVACLVSYSSLHCAPSSDVRQKFQEYRKTMYKQQVCKIKLDSKICYFQPDDIFLWDFSLTAL